MGDKTTGDKIHYCSFCGAAQHEFKQMVLGPEVGICDGCVLIAVREMLDAKTEAAISELKERLDK